MREFELDEAYEYFEWDIFNILEIRINTRNKATLITSRGIINMFYEEIKQIEPIFNNDYLYEAFLKGDLYAVIYKINDEYKLAYL